MVHRILCTMPLFVKRQVYFVGTVVGVVDQEQSTLRLIFYKLVYSSYMGPPIHAKDISFKYQFDSNL